MRIEYANSRFRSNAVPAAGSRPSIELGPATRQPRFTVAPGLPSVRGDRVPGGGVRAWRKSLASAAVSGGLGRDAQAATAGSLTVRLSLTGAMDSSSSMKMRCNSSATIGGQEHGVQTMPTRTALRCTASTSRRKPPAPRVGRYGPHASLSPLRRRRYVGANPARLSPSLVVEEARDIGAPMVEGALDGAVHGPRSSPARRSFGP